MTAIYDGKGNTVNVSELTSYDIPITFTGLPSVYINSSTAYSNLSKETASKGTITLKEGKKRFKLGCTVKLQGEGSLLKQKKNLNIRLFVDDGKHKTKQKVRFGSWYATNKFHLKANEQEYSMSRNSVGARITYEWMGTTLPNGAMGYIDSFPISLYYNNEWLGCYTCNLTQDGHLFNFDDDDELAGTNLAYRIYNGSQFQNSNSWEYRGNEDETPEMRQVLADMLSDFSDTESITKELVEAHFDVDSVVNYLIIAEILKTADSLGNNYTIATWDGLKWYFTWYDLDTSVGAGIGGGGISWTGSVIQNPSQSSDLYRFNQFFVKCTILYADELKEAYARIRKNYDIPNWVYDKFFTFQSKWGSQLLADEVEKWGNDKSSSAVDISVIKAFFTARLPYLDNLYEYSE